MEKRIASHCRVALFSEQDFPSGPKVESSLRGSLVGAGLQSDQTLASAQLLFGKLATVLLRWAWAEVRSTELRMAVALEWKREM